MPDTIDGARVLNWSEEQELYRDVVARLEAAEGPDPALDRDIALFVQEPRGIRFTADLGEVEAWLRRRHPKGGWSVRYLPQIDATVWADGPTREESEFVSSAWRNGSRFYMRHPPANPAIALTLAEMRGEQERFG